ncbi:MAG: oligosaccharide flippase family protein [Planctomycetaceae bacterium]
MTVKINVLAGWLTQVTVMVIGFFLMPYILRTIGDQPYGTWVFVNALVGYTGLLYLGFGDTIARYVSKHHAREEWDKLNEVVSGICAAYCVSGVIAIMASVVVALLVPWIGNWEGSSLREVQGVVLILGVNAAVSIIGSTNGGVLYGIQRFDVEKGILVIGLFVKLGLTLYFLSNEWPLITLALIFAAHTTLEQVLYYLCARWLVPTLRVQWRLVTWAAIKDSYGFALFSSMGLIAAKLIYDTDYIVIGLALGQAAIVPYAIGSRLSEMIRRPILQIGEVFLPRASELHAQSSHDILRSLSARGMGVAFLLSAGLLIGGTYFGQMLINLWMGPDYPESRAIFLMLIGSQVVASPIGILHMVLLGTGDVRFPSMIRLGQAVMNFALSLILVQWYGIYGVAVGTLIPILLMDLGVLLPYGLRRLEMPLGWFLRIGLAPHLLPLGALWAYSHSISMLTLPETWPVFLAVTTGGGAILLLTAGAVWYFTQRLAVTPAVVD